MTGRSFLGIAAVAMGVAACGGATQNTPAPSHRPSPSPSLSPTPSPSGTPAPPAGPFAVAVSNIQRSGSTYTVYLINTEGAVVAHVTAELPRLQPNQSLQLPLVSTSSTTVYYRDGDTAVRSLTPSGATALVKTVTAAAGSEMTFAVSPDDRRVAIVLINEAPQQPGDTGTGYVEDLADSGNHVTLFRNTGPDSFRWPMGWHGSAIVDASGQGGGCYAGACGGEQQAYHVVSSTSGARLATVCETPSGTTSDYYSLEGFPTAAGTACDETEGADCTVPRTETLMSVDWTGTERTFAHVASPANWCGNYQGLQYSQCFLSPDGSRMACAQGASGVLTILERTGVAHSMGHRYNVLGWIDASHLLVDVDSSTLAVLDADDASTVSVPMQMADQMQFGGVLPGGL